MSHVSLTDRVALALAADGWIVRNKVVWSKPNATPSSVADRLQPTHEFIYFLVRSRRCHFNLDAIRVPYRSPARRTPAHTRAMPASAAGPLAQHKLGLESHGGTRHALGKNPGDVWIIPTRPYREAHFATFPAALVEPPLLATCPRSTCASCGAPWSGEQPGCRHNAGRLPGLVLDPFMGTGTVAVVAEQHGRDWLGIELNPAYAALACERLERARRLQEHAG